MDVQGDPLALLGIPTKQFNNRAVTERQTHDYSGLYLYRRDIRYSCYLLKPKPITLTFWLMEGNNIPHLCIFVLCKLNLAQIH